MTEEDTLTPDVQEPCNEDGTVNEAYEYVADPADKPTAPALWVYSWGFLHIFAAVWGYILYAQYPVYIKNNAWWKKQCPSTAWTSALVTATGSGVAAPGSYTVSSLADNGTATATAINTTWTQSTCLSAAPIAQWTTLAWTMMIGYGIVSLVWILNLFLGGTGGTFDLIWLWTSRLTAVQALLTLVFTLLANNAYGSRLQVFTSWFGITALTVAAPAANTAYAAAQFTTTPGTSWDNTKSDKKYLIWKASDAAAVTLLSTDYLLGANLLKEGADLSHALSFYGTLIASILDLALIGLSFMPFTEYYTDLLDWKEGTGEWETDCGADEEEAAEEEESAY